MVSAVDEAVGKIIDILEATGFFLAKFLLDSMFLIFPQQVRKIIRW